MRQMTGDRAGGSLGAHEKGLSLMPRASRSHLKSVRRELTVSDLHSEDCRVEEGWMQREPLGQLGGCCSRVQLRDIGDLDPGW